MVGPRVKGVSFKSVLRALEVLRGPQAAQACTSAMPTDLADAFRYGTMLASSWYPIEWYRALLEAVQTSACEGDHFMCKIGQQCLRQDMTGVYRAVFHLLSPQAVIRISSRLFSNYYDTGKCTILEAKTGFAHASWAGCSGFDRRMWLEAFGACEMVMELSGAKHIRSRVVSGGRDGDDCAELTGHWA
jgi:hypothetical protein